MATTKISTFENRLRKSTRKQVRKVAANRRKIYAVNAVKAAKNVLRK